MTSLTDAIKDSVKEIKDNQISVDELIESLQRYDSLPVKSIASRRQLLHTLISRTYREISLEFLSHKDKDGFPLFPIFRLIKRTDKGQFLYFDINVCQIYGDFLVQRYPFKKSPSYVKLIRLGDEIDLNIFSSELIYRWIPRSILKYYRESMKCRFLQATTHFEPSIFEPISYRVQLTQHFTGFIPDDSMSKILKSTGHFDCMFIVSESFGWREQSAIRQAPSDPLVVGYNKDVDKAFLIDHFDLSPMEEMVVREFAE